MKKVINSSKARSNWTFSQAILAGNTLYISGQLPIDQNRKIP